MVPNDSRSRREVLDAARSVMQRIATIFNLDESLWKSWAAAFTLNGPAGPEHVRLSRAQITIQARGLPDRVLPVRGSQSVEMALGKAVMVDFGEPGSFVRLAKMPQAMVSDPCSFTVYLIKDGEVQSMQDVQVSFKSDPHAWAITKDDLSLTPEQAQQQEEILQGDSALNAFCFARRNPYAADVERLAEMVHSSGLGYSYRDQMSDVLSTYRAFHFPTPDEMILPSHHSRYQRLIVWPAKLMEDAWLNVQVVNLCAAIDNGRLGPGQSEVQIDLDRLVHMSSREEMRKEAFAALCKLPAGNPQRPEQLGISGPNEKGFWVHENLGQVQEAQRERA